LLDPVPPETVFPLFSSAVDALHASGHLEPYRSINGDLLVAVDGTRYFSSSKIHCGQCSVTEHKNGSITYSHTVVTPVIVASGNPRGVQPVLRARYAASSWLKSGSLAADPG
jgi:hypothetical protein